MAAWYTSRTALAAVTADNLNRLDAIQADNSGSPGTTLASYMCLGAGTVVENDYEEPDVRLDLGSGTGIGNQFRLVFPSSLAE